MLKWLMRRRIAAFERAYGYDTSYARDILEASPRAALLFGRIQAVAGFRRDVPKDACSPPSSSRRAPRIAAPARSSSPPWRSAPAWCRGS
jgi:hypothetical protein